VTNLKELENRLDEMEKRIDARFDRMEDMLTQLIGIVGETNKKADNLDKRLDGLGKDVKIIKTEMPKMKRLLNEHDSDITELKFQQ
jgi:chaperonin cofactor prefoldin